MVSESEDFSPSFWAKFENTSGGTEITITPAKSSFWRMGRVNWIDHLLETLPITGRLMNRRSSFGEFLW